ncbi:MAG: acyl carrier protein [Candidatus Krumholzibacteria bacterium]|nr:acyl carrier protein [Candidatus Krumholzibacteria bacterium]
MSVVKAEDVKKFVFSYLEDSFRDINVAEETIADDFDLMKMGIIDSMGLIELTSAIENHFNIELDFETMDANYITVMGPLCRYIEEQTRSGTE